MNKKQIKDMLVRMVYVGPLNTVYDRINSTAEELALEFDKLRAEDKKIGTDGPQDHIKTTVQQRNERS